MKPSSRDPERPYEELSNRAIRWAALALVVLGAGLAAVLLVAFGDGQHAGQLNAIRTAGAIVLGTGGAAALWLAARRQRTSEIALNQKHIDQQAADRAFEFQLQVNEQNRQHMERVAAATEHDAEARRITELYSTSVEQLGSDKAPVRLGGLYALERLAQDNPGQRQTIVNVLCAYLRMPFDTREAQEREVRTTAQRILAKHLERNGAESWGRLDVDLTGAHLIDFTLIHADLGRAWFERAEFEGTADFLGTGFGDALFDEVAFSGEAVFDLAEFGARTEFRQVRFAGAARFSEARFPDEADFHDAKFESEAVFRSAVFGAGRFDGTTFYRGAVFDQAAFGAPAFFRRAEFKGDAGFHGARFEQGAVFDGAQFTDDARFQESAFTGDATFDGVDFAGVASFSRGLFAGNLQVKGARFGRSARFHDVGFEGAVEVTGTEFARGMPDELTERATGPLP
ncbi:pentapeptide repeat-containing protein [Amycolatopsis albispora]|uniref:Pentapeptide repeat-containing protein n=1 Tax=Amycolatopsis albispora TaxID=1804986 RepID=A0A344L5X5_9PSEU|nr:pentapeptide repeat-containing protein [Amycolatopsis albispora]AXB43449.1 hypothetical protein A4R43_13565 [Amycolatopsis albispora]